MNTEERFWKISPGKKGDGWKYFKKNSVIGIGIVNSKDVHGYTEEEVKRHIDQIEDQKYRTHYFIKFVFKLKKGYVVVAYSNKTIFGVGTIIEDDWVFNDRLEKDENYWERNTRKVEWIKNFTEIKLDKSIPLHEEIKKKLGKRGILFKIEKDDFNTLIKPLLPKDFEIEPSSSMDNKKDLTIINLLDNKSQIIFNGPPGTGKTYKAIECAVNFIRENKEDI